jgi:hypothetical protein
MTKNGIECGGNVRASSAQALESESNNKLFEVFDGSEAVGQVDAGSIGLVDEPCLDFVEEGEVLVRVGHARNMSALPTNGKNYFWHCRIFFYAVGFGHVLRRPTLPVFRRPDRCRNGLPPWHGLRLERREAGASGVAAAALVGHHRPRLTQDAQQGHARNHFEAFQRINMGGDPSPPPPQNPIPYPIRHFPRRRFFPRPAASLAVQQARGVVVSPASGEREMVANVVLGPAGAGGNDEHILCLPHRQG